uniref:Uncharacterized protein n=1 Tax=Rhizophora mucronata TaxID=61149 RepID=A0A2P2N9K7_RHIMU
MLGTTCTKNTHHMKNKLKTHIQHHFALQLHSHFVTTSQLPMGRQLDGILYKVALKPRPWRERKRRKTSPKN